MAKTIFEHRLIVALVLCLSGLALLPFDLLPSRVFGWEGLAGAYDLIFWDDFEAGTDKRWRIDAPENVRMFPAMDAESFNQQYSLDQELLAQYDEAGLVLMAGFSPTAEPVFSVEARMSEVGLELRLGASLDNGDWRETDWQQIDEDSVLGIEWQRGNPLAEDGLLYLSLDGRLGYWLTSLDNDSSSLGTIALTKFGVRTLLLPQTPIP